MQNLDAFAPRNQMLVFLILKMISLALMVNKMINKAGLFCL